MQTPAKRILFFAEAVTLAHVTRCVALANALHSTGNYIIALAADNRYDEILGEPPYQRLPLRSVSSSYFLNTLAKGAPSYDFKTLCDYVNDDLAIIEQFKPDFIVGDFRISLAVSSRLKKIPYASITNAYWSPYADLSFPIPESPLARILGVTPAKKLFNWSQPIVFMIHSLALNKTCKKFGQPPLAYDMRDIYTHGDYVLYADIESLVPMKPLPSNHLFIGPILWSAEVPLPEWWEALPTDQPIIFITLGSSGESTLLPMILETLSKMPVTVICVTANKTLIEKTYANVFVNAFLPANEAVKKSDIVICNGGSPMVYQSLIENKSIIGIPSNLDQYLMMSVLQAGNQGQLIRTGEADAKAVHEAVNKAISQLGRTEIPDFKDMLFSIGKIEDLISTVS